MVRRAAFQINFLSHVPEGVLTVPSHAQPTRACTRQTVHGAFESGIGNDILLIAHQGVKPQNLFVCKR